MKRWNIYCRVSTKKQQDNWASLENQEKACRKFCKDNNIQVHWVFTEAFTWKKKDRPVFNEAIKNAKENNIEYFIIFDIDRFSREGYWTYSQLKKELKENWIQLRDSKNVIWDSQIVHENEIVDMSEYKWNVENRSEMAEMVYSAQSKIEWDKILQRTIPREIELEQMWYCVRQPHFWYTTKTAPTPDGKKAKIQVYIPVEWDCVREMYHKRAEGYMSDKEIVDALNLQGYRKRTWKELTVKYLQEVIRKPVYAGVISSKWTWFLPIKTPYEGLVSIELWNKANRGKIEIIEIDKTEVKIEYNNGKEKQINKPIKEKRKDYNPDYPFAKVLKCPICWGTFTGNASKGWNGNLYPYYQCRGKAGEKHTTHTIKLPEVHNVIQDIFWDIEITEASLLAYEDISQEVFQELQKELEEHSKTYDEQIRDLNKKEKEIVDNIDKYLNLEHILKIKNEELETIKADRLKLEGKKKEWEKNTNLERFLYYSKEVITHIDRLALQSEEPELINLAFDVVFDWRIEFDKIQSHTLSNLDFFSLQSQQKNPQTGDLVENSKWQVH